MALIDRLGGISSDPENLDKISVNAFHASMVELANGEITKANMVAYFNLDATEETELDWIIAQYNSQPNAAAKEKFVELMRTLFVLAEANAPGYSTNADLVARINRI